MGLQLEFGEHGLAEEGPAIILHLLAEIEELLLLGLRVLHQVREQQLLVQGRRDLGEEDRIVGLVIGLGRIGEQRVERMAPFMGIGAHPVIFVAQVEQQIGVHVERAGVHIGPRPLALAGPGIHPFGRSRLGDARLIVGAERLHGFERRRAHLVERVAAVHRYQRRIDVVIADVRQLEHLAAQLEIAVELGQPLVRLGHQRAVYGLGHVVAGKRAGERGRVFPCLGIEDVAAHLGAIGRAERVLELAVRGPEGVEHCLAVLAARRVAVERIALRIEADLLAGGERDRRPGNVRRAQLPRDLARRGERRAGAGEDRLALGRERVLGLAQRIGQCEVEPGTQRRIGGEKGVDLRLAERQQLGRGPGAGLAERGVEVARLRQLLLVGRDADVLVALQAGIGVDAADRAAEVRLEHQRLGEHVGAFAKAALEPGDGGNCGERLLAGIFPGGLAGIEFAQVPLRPGGRGGLAGPCRQGGDGAGERGGSQRLATRKFGHVPVPRERACRPAPW